MPVYLRKLLANRGKSSARPVRLDGLQILAEAGSSEGKIAKPLTLFAEYSLRSKGAFTA